MVHDGELGPRQAAWCSAAYYEYLALGVEIALLRRKESSFLVRSFTGKEVLELAKVK